MEYDFDPDLIDMEIQTDPLSSADYTTYDDNPKLSHSQYTPSNVFEFPNNFELGLTLPHAFSIDPDDVRHRYRSIDAAVNYKSVERLLASFQIAPGFSVGKSFPCFIIAEIGQNHQGDINVAQKLIDEAKRCGANCVKFQKSDLRSRFNLAALQRPYVSEHSFGETYGEHRAYLEFTEEEFITLKKYAKKKGIMFSASGMDKNSIDFLYAIDVPFFKIGSADCANYPLLTHTAHYRKPMIISTGMHDFETISRMYNYLYRINTNLALLQCTSSYPTPPLEVNLNVIETYKTKFPFAVVGYSGHEVGIGISIAAVALGAKILERHITLDHDMKGTDHASSLEPSEFSQLVTEVRRVEAAMRYSDKIVQNSEGPCIAKLAKSVVATRDLRKGTILKEDMYELKVAFPKGWDGFNSTDLVGRRLLNKVCKNCTIMNADILGEDRSEATSQTIEEEFVKSEKEYPSSGVRCKSKYRNKY